jgi:hypothetical protein
MNAPRNLLPLCGWLLLLGTAPTAAQVSVPVPPRGVPKPKPVPVTTILPTLRHTLTSVPFADLQELDFGTFFQNEERTLCVLASGIVIEIHDPSVFSIESLEIQMSGVSSAAALPTASAGGAAHLFAADSAGLSEVPGALTWVFQAPDSLQGAPWAEARELQALREDGVPIVLGIAADRMSIRTLVDLGAGWVPGPNLSIGEPIEDMVLLDFFAGGLPEIAALGYSGVYVLEQSGSIEAFFPSEGTSSGEIERVRGDEDRLAWATLDGDGSWVLQVLGQSSTEDPLSLALPIVVGQAAEPLDVAAMTSGDLDGDGYEDLVLTDYVSHRAVLLWNRVLPNATFATSAIGTDHVLLHVRTPATLPGTGNDCAPLVADLDGDGRQDIAFGLDTTSEVVLFLSVPNPSAPAVAAILSNGSVVPATTYYNEAGCLPPSTNSCTEGVLNLAFNLTQQLADTYDYVEVIVWRQPVEGGDLEPLSISHTLHPFYGTPPRDPHQWIQVPIPETWVVWPAGQHYWVRTRFCRADVVPDPPVILAATSSATMGLTLRHNGTYGWPPLTLEDSDFDYLEAQSTGYGALLADLPFPDGSAFPLLAAGRPHLAFAGGFLPSLLGNAYVGAYYVKVKVPSPPGGSGLETTSIVFVSNQLVPW